MKKFKENSKNVFNKIKKPVFYVVSAVVLWAVLSQLFAPTIGMIIYSFVTSQDEEPVMEYTNSFGIEALKDNQYAYNNIQSDKVNYLREVEKGIVSESVYSDDVVFIETTDDPHVEVYNLYPSENTDFHKKLAQILSSTENPHFIYQKYIFYIPEGSLETDFSVDLE